MKDLFRSFELNLHLETQLVQSVMIIVADHDNLDLSFLNSSNRAVEETNQRESSSLSNEDNVMEDDVMSSASSDDIMGNDVSSDEEFEGRTKDRPSVRPCEVNEFELMISGIRKDISKGKALYRSLEKELQQTRDELRITRANAAASAHKVAEQAGELEVSGLEQRRCARELQQLETRVTDQNDTINALKIERVNLLPTKCSDPTCDYVFCPERRLVYCAYDHHSTHTRTDPVHGYCSECVESCMAAWVGLDDRQAEYPEGICCQIPDCPNRTRPFTEEALLSCGVASSTVTRYLVKVAEVKEKARLEREQARIRKEELQQSNAQRVQEASVLRCPACKVPGSVDNQCLCVHCPCGVTFCGWCYEWHTDPHSNRRNGVRDEDHVRWCEENKLYQRDVRNGVPHSERVVTFMNKEPGLYREHISNLQERRKQAEIDKINAELQAVQPFDLQPGQGHVGA